MSDETPLVTAEHHFTQTLVQPANIPAVILDGVGLTYALGSRHVVRAVDDVSLRIAAGTWIALLGASGSGKSSLLQLIGGLQRPTEGRITVSGKSLEEADRAWLATFRLHHIGFVFQSFHLLPHLQAWENVALPLIAAGVAPSDRKARAMALLADVGLGDRVLHRPGELSGGEQQRVALARAMVNRPRLLIADEPTGNLDEVSAELVLEVLAQFVRGGTTLICANSQSADCGARGSRDSHASRPPSSRWTDAWANQLMRVADYIRLSGAYALRRRWRAVPSLIGVALGVAGLVVVLTAAETIHATNGQELGQQSLRQITVTSVAPDGPNGLTTAAIERLGRLAHVSSAYPVAEADVAGTTPTGGYIVPVGNLPPGRDRPALALGVWPTDNEVTVPDSGFRDKTGNLLPGAALVGQTLALHVRALQGLGPETVVPVRVVGTYRTQGPVTRAVGYATLATVTHLLALTVGSTDGQYLSTATYPACILDVDATENVAAVASTVDSQGFVTAYVDKQVAGLTGHLQGVQVTAAAVALFVIVVCALSMANLVASSVRQRRSELGIMLAIGFGHRTLAALVAGEALATGVAGAVIGILLAVLGIFLFSATHSISGLTVPWVDLPIVALLSGLLCLLAGVFPARRVMRMDCVEAIRAE